MTGETAVQPPTQAAFWILIALASFLFLFRLGNFPLADYDEAIYAQVIADTQSAGDFFSLHSGAGPFFDKPPLYFWLAMGSEKLFGNDAFALRFPAAALGIVAVALTFLIGLEMSGSVLAAFLSGFALLTTGAFLEAGRQVRLDAPVIATILFALYCFLRGKRDARWYAGVCAAIAAGVMLKSVIGLFALIPILAWSLLHRDFSWLKSGALWLGALAGLLILAPWHLAETLRFGATFWDNYFFHHVLERFGSDIVGTGGESNWSYAKYSFLYGLPWVLVFLGGAAWLLRKQRRSDAENRGFFALAASAVAIFALFAAAQTKLFYYVLPAFPLIALCGGIALARFPGKHPDLPESKRRAAGVAVICVIGLANAVYVGFHFEPDFANNQRIVNDEYRIGSLLAARPEPYGVKAFEYRYWDTMHYYSGRSVSLLQNNDVATEPFFLVIESSLFQETPFPEPVMQHLTSLYEGPDLTLLVFRP